VVGVVGSWKAQRSDAGVVRIINRWCPHWPRPSINARTPIPDKLRTITDHTEFVEGLLYLLLIVLSVYQTFLDKTLKIKRHSDIL
jgi:hypothetical protein